MRICGWDRLDVVIVTGDAYLDSPYAGAAVIGRVLADAGHRVGIVPQPDLDSERDIASLGEPELFWGVTGGCVDSMVANYTASGKRRKSDDMTPGGMNVKRPDRAVIVYSNLVRRFFKNTKPVVLGGIEASLRRISHYDAWSDSIRRSILFDAKADFLVYGMGERAVLELARALREGGDVGSIRGICYIDGEIPEESACFDGPDIRLPDHATVAENKDEFSRMFRIFYENADPVAGKRLYQLQDTRFLVQNPPQPPPSPRELDRIYELPFARMLHPRHEKEGRVKAMDTIGFSLTTHRGCYGECRFCAIAVHQGKHVVSRSRESILREAKTFLCHPDFKGVVSDVGGPTANMYGIECELKKKRGACKDKSCIFPEICRHLPVNHRSQIELLKALRGIEGVRKVFVGSGVRYDLVAADQRFGTAYLENLVSDHISGQLKIAPEHAEAKVLNLMGKPGGDMLENFIGMFERAKRKKGAKAFLTYYLMAAHPGCTQKDMEFLGRYASLVLRLIPEQIQIFTPTPSTYSTLMYCTEKDPFTGERIFVEKNPARKEMQKNALGGARKKRSLSNEASRKVEIPGRKRNARKKGRTNMHGSRIS